MNNVFIWRGLCRFLLLSLLLIFVTLTIFGCRSETDDASQSPSDWTFYDVPDVTAEEIAAIEELQKRFDHFSFGTLHSTEAFIANDDTGQMGGYVYLFCKWMSHLFGIEFVPEFLDWDDFYPTLQVDFTSELTDTQQRRDEHGFLFSLPVAERHAKYYKLEESVPRLEILRTRAMRIGFFEGSTTAEAAIASISETIMPTAIEPFYVQNHDEAYAALVDGTIDAFVTEMTSEVTFNAFPDVVSEDFMALIDLVSLTTQNHEFEPIINVLDKALRHGATQHLYELYDMGAEQYRKYKLMQLLGDAEL